MVIEKGAVVPSAVMVAPAGILAPVMGCPISNPLVLCIFVRILLPDVAVPVVETVLEALAFADIVTVFVARESVLMVVPTAMPTPAVRGCRTTNPVVVLATFVMFALPLVTMPLNVTMFVVGLEAEAGPYKREIAADVRDGRPCGDAGFRRRPVRSPHRRCSPLA